MAEGGKALQVQVEGALPKRAVVTLRVTREFITPTRHAPVVLKEILLPFEEEGRAEILLEIGDALAVPGKYRVRVSFEAQGQYPDVLKTVGDAGPAPAEVVLDEAVASKDYMASLLKEQATLADSILEVGDFLDRMNALEAEVAGNKEQGVAAWAAWRPQAVSGLERIIQHGREVRECFYPETHDQFSESFVFSGLFQMESRKFSAAQAGGGYHGTGAFRDKPKVVRGDALPCEAVFRMETVYYRLAVMNGLYNAVLQELAAQGKRPDPARWDRKRAGWGEILALWLSDVGPPAEPASDRAPAVPLVKQVLHREGLAALGGAMAAWLDATEDDRPAGQQAVVERFREVRDLLQKKP
jgi:hypothetical protein